MKYLTKKEISRVDKLAVEVFNLSVKQMMENAGRNVAEFIATKLKPRKVFIFYGKGNNGGDGLAMARHLAIKGFKIEIVPAVNNLNSNAKNQLKILAKMGIKPSKNFKVKKGDVFVDALLGYNIKGNPKGKYAKLIDTINSMKKYGIKVVSFDLPSGMNPDTGECYGSCICPDYTLTLALPKIGLKKAKLKNVYLVNIGIPNELYSKYLKIRINCFNKGDIIRIT